MPVSDSRRVVVITGARQTGKTTLVRSRFPELPYINCDSSDDRERLARLSASRWARAVGPAVIDEAQKEPSVFEKVKYAYDEHSIDFSVLLGSSRFLLMKGVQESLAGRAFLYELWPLMASELRYGNEEPAIVPLFDRVLASERRIDDVLEAEPAARFGDDHARRVEALDHLAAWGGMPELLRLDDADRRDWLRSYQQTFLERDLADLVRLSDLEPFRTLQRLCMLRSGHLLSYAELARDAGIGVSTARRYLEYLRISYQVWLLPPYSTNLTSQAIKSPKLYWTDIGLVRQGTQFWGELTGHHYETLIVGEALKWISTMALPVETSFYRTRSGLEVDLMFKTPHGLIGAEIKKRGRPAASDISSLRAVAAALGTEWLGGLLIHGGDSIERLDEALSIWSVPAAWLF